MKNYAVAHSDHGYGAATHGLDRANTTRPDRETINKARARAGLPAL